VIRFIIIRNLILATGGNHMSNFVFTYLAGQGPASPEKSAESMAAWQAWLEDLGDAAVNPGTAFTASKTVSADSVSDGSGPVPLMGFTIVKADSLEAALDMAKSCPFLEMGTLVVSETMQM
jgi:hypothetical protein